MSRIEFSSTRFLPYLPESCQVNPGVYGFELATWLSRKLAEAGFPTSYPTNEDWGWYIEYVEDEAAYLIGCGCAAQEGEGREPGALGADGKVHARLVAPGHDRHAQLLGSEGEIGDDG